MKGFKFWDPISKKMVINRDVVFDEQSMLLEIVHATMQVSNGVPQLHGGSGGLRAAINDS